jgi:lysophospholipase L1-like esterase
MSVQVTYKKQVIFYILITLILIFALEGSLRVYFYFDMECLFETADVHLELNYFEKRQICHEFWYVDSKHPKDAISYYLPNQHGQTINMNNFGFRGPDISYEKPADTFRIFMIGGSTTFGAPASSDSTTIAGYLQEYFNEADMPKTIEVINAGRSSFFSLPEVQLIKSKLLELEPDLFLVYDGWNDIDHTIETHLGKKYQTNWIDDIVEDGGEHFPEYRTLKILRHIQYQLKMATNDSVNNTSPQFDTASIPQKVQLWEERWRDICILGQDKGFGTIITLQPLVGSGNKVLSDLEQIYFEEHIIQFIPYYEQYADAMKRLEKDCTGTIDLRFVADPYSHTIFYDGGHVVDEGNEIVAKEIYQVILPIVLEDISK